jgi:type I restriction enzyme, S subunit
VSPRGEFRLPRHWAQVTLGEVATVIRGVTYRKGDASTELAGAACLAAAFDGAWSSPTSGGLPIVPLDDLAFVQSGIAKGRPSDDATHELPYIRTANVQAGYLDLAVIKTLAVTWKQREKYRLQDEDVLVLEGGDADKVGRGWIWEGQLAECLHQNHVFAVRTGERLLAKYLAHFLNAPQARAYFLGCAKQTTNLASINKRQLKALPVPVPEVVQQAALVAMLDRQLAAARKQEAALSAHIEDATRLDAALLNQALNGGLVQQMPSLDDSSSLAARARGLRAQREIDEKRRRRIPVRSRLGGSDEAPDE